MRFNNVAVLVLMAVFVISACGRMRAPSLQQERELKRNSRGSGTEEQDRGLSPLCYYNPQYSNHMIYLHGWIGITNEFYDQFEKQNRRTLLAVSDQCKLNIVLPRSYRVDECSNKTVYCWNIAKDDRVEKVLPDILAKAKDCFGEKNNKALIGFSDGGYFVAHVSQSTAYQRDWIKETPHLAVTGAPNSVPGPYDVVSEMASYHAISKESLIDFLRAKQLCN